MHPAPAPQRVAVPAAAPVISPEYLGRLSAWLERHKLYPESARQRGEQGVVMLRFHITRSGQVLDHAVIRSSGYPDLDASVEAMMRGVVLPPFTPDMATAEVTISVPIRFGLTR